jgi:hypothetical protein
MSAPKHANTGRCPKCAATFDRYPGAHPGLRSWFVALQLAHPEAHISDAGRGAVRQEEYYYRGATRAHWTESSHNWNAAIDIFELRAGVAKWDQAWFDRVVDPALTVDLLWYGKPRAKFRELPHVEVKGWKILASKGLLKLVE